VTRRTLSFATAAFAGALFGAGLLLSGMTDPARVIGFLDVTRNWDPTLVFVMVGAVGVYAFAYAWIRRRGGNPWFERMFALPTRRDVDVPLVVGAAIFGIGWGIAGICPGPGIVVAAAGSTMGLAFVAAMVVGMYLHRAVTRAQAD
jgi:uncharacterized protein